MSALDEFRAGVTACLRSWSALRTAVESGWGGGDIQSQKKAEDLRQIIFDLLNGQTFPPKIDLMDLSDNLAIYMEEEFSVTVEDNSEQQVAEVLFRMYEGLSKGDLTLCRQMVAHADGAINMQSQFGVQIQTTEHDDDDDDDMTDSQAPGQANSLAPVVNPIPAAANFSDQPLFGKPKKPQGPVGPARQLGEAAAPKPVVEVDDDGFAPVKPKGKRQK